MFDLFNKMFQTRATCMPAVVFLLHETDSKNIKF